MSPEFYINPLLSSTKYGGGDGKGVALLEAILKTARTSVEPGLTKVPQSVSVSMTVGRDSVVSGLTPAHTQLSEARWGQRRAAHCIKEQEMRGSMGLGAHRQRQTASSLCDLPSLSLSP